MENKISEAIWANNEVLIPMAEVSHLEYEALGGFVIFKHSKKNSESKLLNKYEPSVFLSKNDFKSFQKAYCYYRYELDVK